MRRRYVVVALRPREYVVARPRIGEGFIYEVVAKCPSEHWANLICEALSSLDEPISFAAAAMDKEGA